MRFPRFCMTTPRAISCLVPLKKVTSAEETLCSLVRCARFLNSFEGLSPVVACLAFRYRRRNESMHYSRLWKDAGAIALTAFFNVFTKFSAKPLDSGSRGAVNTFRQPTDFNQCCTSLDVKCVPLSVTAVRGTPSRLNVLRIANFVNAPSAFVVRKTSGHFE